MKYLSSSNSFAVSRISCPSRETSWLSSSIVRSPTTSVEASRSAVVPARRQSPQPRDDLLEAERLGHVVVAAGGQTRDAVLDGVLGGQEQDRDMRLRRADSA